jgi:RND family efflux transporter MFP subunit
LQTSKFLVRAAAFGFLLSSLAACRPRTQPVSGTIEVDEVHVAPRTGGRVEKLFVQEGDTLHPGQPLAQLVAPEMQARRALAQAQIDTAMRDADAHAAQLEFMQADARRQENLLRSKTVSPNEAERARSAAATEEKSLDAARMRIVQMRAQFAEIEAELRELNVVAPNDCVVEVLNVKVGDVLAPNQELATLILPQHLWVRVYVPEPWLGYIKLGQGVRARVDSFGEEEFTGRVEQINRQAEFTPRNVQTVEDRIRQVFGVKIRLQNHDDKLRSGMSADVTFPNAPASK